MAKKGGSDWLWLILGGAAVTAAILYAQKNSRLRAEVDAVVAELNRRFGKRWVDLGAAALKAYLRTTPLGTAVRVFDAVYAVEQMARLTGADKQAEAVRRLE